MAKRFDHLFASISSLGNLFQAYRKASRGKRGQPEVADFEFDLEANLFDLHDELRTQTYRPGGYHSFYIRDPKRRLISAAAFRDRVVHHALVGVIEPLFERTFIGDSYANRKKKGTHAALDKAQAYAGAYPYVLQGDIRQFFPSIDHAILGALLERKLGDPRALELCELILAGGAGVLQDEYDMVFFPGDDESSRLRPRGLPIGNLTSQFWANVYLNELDQFVKRTLRAPAYVRYVDDFLLFSHSKAQLWEWKSAIREKVHGLRLTLHEGSSTVYPVSSGIPFLGYRLYPTHRRLKRRNGVAFQRRFRRLRQDYTAGLVSLETLQHAVQGWSAHAAHASTRRLRRSLLNARLVPPSRRVVRGGAR